MKESELNRLVERFCQGDRSACDELARELEEKLKSRAQMWIRLRRSRNHVQTTELFDQLWLEIMRSGKTRFEGHRHFLNYCGWKMGKIVIDLARKRDRLPGHNAVGAVDVADDRADDIHDDLESRERAEAVEQAIARLPETEAEVVHLHYFIGLSFRQIEELTGIPKSTVKRLFDKAQGRLKEALEHLFAE